MSRFFSSALSGLKAYTPGEQPRDQRYNKLNTNESPFPPSEKALRCAAEAAEKLNLYSDPACAALTAAMAETLSVCEDEIIWGNGSDEILFFAFNAFCTGARGAVYPDVTYGFYDSSAGLCRAEVTKIPLKDDLSVCVDEYLNVGKTIFLANPNAPTGIALPLSEIERLVQGNPDSVVVVDEAYVDFGAQSAVPLIHRYSNLLVVQTFSKSRSMAGARLGCGIGCADLIRDLNTVKYSLNPYNINSMTMAAGIGTLADADYTRRCCEKVMETRAYTQERLAEMGFEFPYSSTNFVFAKHPKLDGRETYLTLKERGILVRHFDTPRLRQYNRITVGAREQMDALLDALKTILEETA